MQINYLIGIILKSGGFIICIIILYYAIKTFLKIRNKK